MSRAGFEPGSPELQAGTATQQAEEVGFTAEQKPGKHQPATGRRAAGNRQTTLRVRDRRLAGLLGLGREAKVGGRSGRQQVIGPRINAGESGMRAMTIWQRVYGVTLPKYWFN